MPKYNSVNNIPAKLFFDVLHNKDFSLLEPLENETDVELEEVFVSIYDDYFVKSENHKSKSFLELRQQVAFITYKIESIVQVLDFLMFNVTTAEIRKELIEALIFIGVNINIENNFLEEIPTILQVELGVLQNDLNFAKMELDNINSENTEHVFNFYESLVNLESVHERNLNDEMVLAKYLVYEQLAVKKAELQKQKNAKFNTY